MKKPGKLSKFSGDIEDLRDYATQVDRDLTNIFEYNFRTPTIYQLAAEPTLGTNEVAYWLDTGSSKIYLIANIGGSQKKVELT